MKKQIHDWPLQFVKIWLFLVLMSASGCATFSDDHGFTQISQISQQQLGQQPKWQRNEEDRNAIKEAVKAILLHPLSAQDALQLALLKNPELQATFSDLSIAEADLVQSTRLQNPGLSYKRMQQGAEATGETTIGLNLIQLITMPWASRLEARKFEQVKLMVAQEVLRVAKETRMAYYEAIAAQQSVSYAKQSLISADAAAELATRMVRAGNWSKLDQFREQIYYSQAVVSVAKANREAVIARENLTRLLGLWGDEAQYRLPERLEDLPAKPVELPYAESLALKSRIDLQIAKKMTESTAADLGLSNATRFINVLDLGYIHEQDLNSNFSTGYEISLEIPLFDWGGAKVEKAESIYMQSVQRLAENAIKVRSEVREHYHSYRTAYDIAKHYRDEIVPLNKSISEEHVLKYNGMLISVFELLADARTQIESVNGYIDALKEFWLAETELQHILGGKLIETEMPTRKES